MIHRDVKPENVLIADDGRIKVASFGLARAVSAKDNTATGGILIGTVSYLSPSWSSTARPTPRRVRRRGAALRDAHRPQAARGGVAGRSPTSTCTGRPRRRPRRSRRWSRRTSTRSSPGRRPATGAARPTRCYQVRRVRAALDHGVTDDPELTADLAPSTGAPAPDDDIDYVREDAPTIVAPAAAAAVVGHRGSDAPAASDHHEHTSVIGAGLPGDRPSPAPARGEARGRSDVQPGAPRRSRRGPLLLALVLVLATVAGLVGWHYGVGRYATPGVINLSQAQAREKVQAAGLSFEVADRATARP